MKRLFILATVVLLLGACRGNPGSGEGGVVDDGTKAINLNKPEESHPATDTAKGEDRADIQQRK